MNSDAGIFFPVYDIIRQGSSPNSECYNTLSECDTLILNATLILGTCTTGTAVRTHFHKVTAPVKQNLKNDKLRVAWERLGNTRARRANTAKRAPNMRTHHRYVRVHVCACFFQWEFQTNPDQSSATTS